MTWHWRVPLDTITAVICICINIYISTECSKLCLLFFSLKKFNGIFGFSKWYENNWSLKIVPIEQYINILIYTNKTDIEKAIYVLFGITKKKKKKKLHFIINLPQLMLTSNSMSNMGQIMNWDSFQLKTQTHTHTKSFNRRTWIC